MDVNEVTRAIAASEGFDADQPIMPEGTRVEVLSPDHEVVLTGTITGMHEYRYRDYAVTMYEVVDDAPPEPVGVVHYTCRRSEKS